MIKTPQAERKRRFKTESGYKLRGAMTWVVFGILSGLGLALVGTAVLLAWTKYFSIAWDPQYNVCPHPPTWMIVFNGLRAIVMFAAITILLFFARKSVKRNAEPKYGEFASDIADWFGFGGLIALAAFGVPLMLAATFVNVC